MGMSEEHLRRQGQRGIANLASLSSEEQAAFMMQAFGSLAEQLQVSQTASSDPYQAALSEFGFGALGARPLGPTASGLMSAVSQAGLAIKRGTAGEPLTPLGRAFLQAGRAAGTGAEAAATTGQSYIVSSSGRVLYRDEMVIADPANQQVLFDETNEEQTGSQAWLAKVQRTWKQNKVTAWRKKLADMGYQVEREGAFAEDLRTALRTYHELRYLNYDQPLALTPTAKEARTLVRKSYDREAVMEDVKGWGEAVGFELDDDTAGYFTDRILKKATQLARKHPEWTMEQIQSGAQMRVQKEFVDRPAVKQELRELEEDEMDESLRQSIVSISQLAAI